MARLSREFYAQDTLEAARALLGKVLVRRLDGETLAGRIVETEAYVGPTTAERNFQQPKILYRRH